MIRRWGSRAVAFAAVCALAAGCVADPPPPDDPLENGAGGNGEAVQVSAQAITVALDSLTGGFNPHLVDDQSTSTDLFSALTLPSAFRPDDAGEMRLDEALLESATVLTEEPFTVRYIVHPTAQWSDSVPIGAEDFDYLWRQMTSQPGVVDPRGYEHIREVRARSGGKTVDVEFAEPFARWRTLFGDLLPAHLLRDQGNGFLAGLDEGIPVSGGPFMVQSMDLGRGEISMVPNDRYWAGVPELGQLVVRRSTGTSAFGQALRTDAGTLAITANTAVSRDVVRTIPELTSFTTAATAQLELTLNTATEPVASPGVREAITSAVDAATVARIVTGESEPTVTRFPFESGDPEPEAPRGADLEAATDALESAGYERDGDGWAGADGPLSLTIGVNLADGPAILAANTIADQLRTLGIETLVWELDSTGLYADALPGGLVDAVVSRQPIDVDPVVAAISRFGCARPPEPGGEMLPTAAGPEADDEADPQAAAVPTPSRPAMTGGNLRPPSPAPQTDEPTTTSPTPTTTIPPAEPLAARASDIAGLCDARIDEALAGAVDSTDPAADLSAAGDLVDEANVRLPLVLPRRLVAHGADVTRLPAPDETDLESDLMASIPEWRRPR